MSKTRISLGYTVVQKTSPFHYSNNIVNCQPIFIILAHIHYTRAPPFLDDNKKLTYCWETVRRESMPGIAEMDVEMTT